MFTRNESLVSLQEIVHVLSAEPDWITITISIVAASVTAITAFLIWRQVIAANGAIGVANETLKVTQLQQTQSAYMAIEATKARIDTNSPTISVSITDLTRIPLFITSRHDSRQFEEIVESHTLSPKNDSERKIAIAIPVQIRNEGSKSTQIHFDGPIFNYDFFASKTMNDLQDHLMLKTYILRSGDSVETLFITVRTVEDWISTRGQNRESRPPAGCYAINIKYEDSLDTGSSDIQTVSARGSLVSPTSLSSSDTCIVDADNMTIKVNPIVRHYWLSKQSDIKLPELPISAITEVSNPQRKLALNVE